MSIVYGIFKAVLAHLYLGWNRPFAARTYKTLTRDVNELISIGILEKTPDGVRARKKRMKDKG